MDEHVRNAVAGAEAYVVGGAVRDELLGRPVLDVDVACDNPEQAARLYRQAAGGAVFLLSERHGAWRVALPAGLTVDFTLLQGTIEQDLSGRDFTLNAIAVPVDGGEPIDPFGGRADLEARTIRAVSDRIFADDPLRLLRAVRLEDELGFRLDSGTELLIRRMASLVTAPAGERILAELERLSPDGYRRLAQLGLLAELGGSTERLERVGAEPSRGLLLVAVLGDAVLRLPVSNATKRFAKTVLRASPPADGSPRAIHRFRRATEPWALEVLALTGADGLAAAVETSRRGERDAPLVRGDELGVVAGPEVGRLLELIAEERAAGTITTREEALELVRRERS